MKSKFKKFIKKHEWGLFALAYIIPYVIALTFCLFYGLYKLGCF